MALAGLVDTTGGALALMSCAVFFLYLTGGTYWAIIQDTVTGARIGSVSGFVHALANCAGIVGPSVTGLLVQGTGAYTSAFVLAGVVAAFVRPITTAARGLTAEAAQ